MFGHPVINRPLTYNRLRETGSGTWCAETAGKRTEGQKEPVWPPLPRTCPSLSDSSNMLGKPVIFSFSYMRQLYTGYCLFLQLQNHYPCQTGQLTKVEEEAISGLFNQTVCFINLHFWSQNDSDNITCHPKSSNRM